ncbi:hypothetical protein N7539_005187 [Penicillium diatomitis]|uniref:Uncharacterized protein n=1 Tax=Penicillium diatomitis TaxID=2819901 RepID=A0A9W9X6E5_9EURO|nr:uncharacterized protein N7539_005187 [Penicillium diatomitis]KAJ5485199.1 hypothetical protein N7539_005187 [Penicillium diatomitis]
MLDFEHVNTKQDLYVLAAAFTTMKPATLGTVDAGNIRPGNITGVGEGRLCEDLPKGVLDRYGVLAESPQEPEKTILNPQFLLNYGTTVLSSRPDATRARLSSVPTGALHEYAAHESFPHESLLIFCKTCTVEDLKDSDARARRLWSDSKDPVSFAAEPWSTRSTIEAGEAVATFYGGE